MQAIRAKPAKLTQTACTNNCKTFIHRFGFPSPPPNPRYIQTGFNRRPSSFEFNATGTVHGGGFVELVRLFLESDAQILNFFDPRVDITKDRFREY